MYLPWCQQALFITGVLLPPLLLLEVERGGINQRHWNSPVIDAVVYSFLQVIHLQRKPEGLRAETTLARVLSLSFSLSLSLSLNHSLFFSPSLSSFHALSPSSHPILPAALLSMVSSHHFIISLSTKPT